MTKAQLQCKLCYVLQQSLTYIYCAEWTPLRHTSTVATVKRTKQQ
jgi:hypothetical protein